MGDFLDERTAFISRFQTAWGTTTPVRWENAPWVQPVAVPWVAFFLRSGAGQQASINTRPLHRFAGVVMVQVFVPEETGEVRAHTLADQIAAVFRTSDGHGAQFTAGTQGQITCRTPYAETVPARDGWFQMNVVVPYIREKVY